MQILITDTTIVNFGDDKGGQVIEAPNLPDVNKDTAKALVISGRALYVHKADDPEKGAPNAASPEMIKAAKAAIAERDKAASTDAPA